MRGRGDGRPAEALDGLLADIAVVAWNCAMRLRDDKVEALDGLLADIAVVRTASARPPRRSRRSRSAAREIVRWVQARR
jgi:hypothetical protein